MVWVGVLDDEDDNDIFLESRTEKPKHNLQQHKIYQKRISKEQCYLKWFDGKKCGILHL